MVPGGFLILIMIHVSTLIALEKATEEPKVKKKILFKRQGSCVYCNFEV